MHKLDLLRNGPYILIVAPPDYPGKLYRDRYCYEHHLVWWRHTGELVPDGSVIHHINDDKHDNRIENLALKTNQQHALDHARRAEPVRLTCAWCGEEFEIAARNYRFKAKNGQKDFFCGRSHAALAQFHCPVI